MTGHIITPTQRAIMQHALGLQRNTREYRNHFVTGPGSDDYPDCRALVLAGLMRDHEASQITGGDPWFSVTDEGRKALRAWKEGA